MRKYYDTFDFVACVVNVKERFVLPEAGDRVISGSDPKRPNFEAVSPCQCGVANARIIYARLQSWVHPIPSLQEV